MKKIIVSLLIVISSISCIKAQKKAFSKEALSEKLMAPNREEIDFKTILEKHKGKAVVIEIWASWCGDCVKAMPQMKTLQTDNPNVDYVFISMDKTPEKWLLGIEKHDLKGDHYLAKDGMKGVFGKAVDVDWIPRYLILDKNGKIVLYRAIETDFEKINTTLKKLK
jgi:thiol-disulfide isomerase/thioredoxin